MSEGSTDPTPETMAREAGYIEGSAMERAFCTGVDTERLRQEAKRRAAVLAERERCIRCISMHCGDDPSRFAIEEIRCGGGT